MSLHAASGLLVNKFFFVLLLTMMSFGGIVSLFLIDTQLLLILIDTLLPLLLPLVLLVVMIYCVPQPFSHSPAIAKETIEPVDPPTEPKETTECINLPTQPKKTGIMKSVKPLLPPIERSSTSSIDKISCKEPGCTSPNHDRDGFLQILHFGGVPFGMKFNENSFQPLGNVDLPYYPVLRFQDGSIVKVTVGSCPQIVNPCELCVYSDGHLIDMPPVPLIPGDYVEFPPDEQMNHNWGIISPQLDRNNPLLKHVSFNLRNVDAKTSFSLSWILHNPFRLMMIEGPACTHQGCTYPYHRKAFQADTKSGFSVEHREGVPYGKENYVSEFRVLGDLFPQ